MPEVSGYDLVWNQLGSRLKTRCDVDGAIGYYLIDLKTSRRQGFNEDVVFPTASTIKIAVLLALAARVHSGKLQWGSSIKVKDEDRVPGSGVLSLFSHEAVITIEDLARLMIAVSDNTATNICIELAGMDYVNSLLRDLGLEKTSLRRKMMDARAVAEGHENVSTPRELAILMEAIYHRTRIPAEVAAKTLEILSLPKDGPFSVGLPQGVKRANKPGGLGHVSVDAGIVFLPQHPYVLAVMGSFLMGDREGLTSSLVRTAHRYMEVIDRCTEYGRA